MEMILGLLNFILFIALILGLVKPALILRWTNKPTRLKVIGYWILSIIITSVLAVMVIDTEPSIDDEVINSLSENDNINKVETLSGGLVSFDSKVSQDMYPYKIAYDIKLDKRVTSQTIKKIAKKIKPTKDYQKVLMNYIIPGWYFDGKGSWATSHYDPELKINILGATLEQVEKINSVKINGDIIGEWWLSTPYFEGRVLLVKQNNKYYIKQIVGDGSELSNQVKIKNKKGMKVYQPLKTKDEYWVLEKNGNIASYDNYGKIWEAVIVK